MSIKRQAKRTKAKTGREKGPIGRGEAVVRGEPVVRGVLDAAIEELARAGYAALRIEDVATRAGVNKTTVYRRWPTKEDLVRAALLSLAGDVIAAPNTGSLREDLLEAARNMIVIVRSPRGRSILRVLGAEGPDSELMVIARTLRKTYEAIPRSMIEAAQARGELAPGIDAMLLFDVLGAVIHDAVYSHRHSLDEDFLNRLIDLLLLGALAPQERAKARAKRRSSR